MSRRRRNPETALPAGEIQRRTLTLEAPADGARAMTATLSSEAPVERSFGPEVLDHSPSSVDLSRARDGLALLLGHDVHALPIGRVEAIRLEGRRLRGRLRFGSSTRATEALADIRAGIATDLSVGYRVDRTTPRAGGGLTVTRWTPVEVSLVGVGADAAAGIGRSFSNATKETEMGNVQTTGDATAERERVKAILGSVDNERATEECKRMATRAVSDGWSYADFAKWVQARGPQNEGVRPELPEFEARADGAGYRVVSGVGSARREGAEGYSLTRALNALASKDFRGADRELEESDRLASEAGRAARGLFVPLEALAPSRGTRAIEKGAGSPLVATEIRDTNFIEMLRNRSRVLEAGATVLPGLRGDITIPRRLTGAAVEWLGESADVTASTPTFDGVTMRPRTLAARVDISRRMLLQSTPAVENLTREDLVAAIGTELDRAALLGDGTGATPTGIANMTAVPKIVRITPDGEGPGLNLILEMEKVIAEANADRGLTLLVNAATRARMKNMAGVNTFESGGLAVALWQSREDGAGDVVGHRALVTNQLPSNLVKGDSGETLSMAILGSFPDLLIAMWGRGVEVTVDPYTLGDRGALVLRVFLDVDIAVRHAESFAVANDIITELIQPAP